VRAPRRSCHARVTFEQDGTAQAHAARQGGRQPRVRDVADAEQSFPEIVHVDGLRHRAAFSLDSWESGNVRARTASAFAEELSFFDIF